jgi:hypothetical protein
LVKEVVPDILILEAELLSEYVNEGEVEDTRVVIYIQKWNNDWHHQEKVFGPPVPC